MRAGLRRRGGPPPDSPRDLVLMISQDAAASAATVRSAVTAARAAGGHGISVVLPLRIHGFAFGLPNPGLMPTARERAVAEKAISDTVRAVTRQGMAADGHIIVTRNAAKAVERAVRRRSAQRVLVEQQQVGRARRLIEGDVCRQLRRRLGRSVVVESTLLC